MTHRGGIAADGKTGDGCGLLLQMPADFMRDRARDLLGRELKPTLRSAWYSCRPTLIARRASERPLLSLRLNLIFSSHLAGRTDTAGCLRRDRARATARH